MTEQTASLPRPVGASLRPRLRSLARGRPADPAWVRPAFVALLALAAVLCLWGLTQSGYSNEYYAAAVKSGTESWKAWFFGSLDPGSFITVDKPPLSLWLMGLSGRVLGFSSFSMLLPQALCTIAAVGLLFATVRRALGPAAGLAAGAALALTPITVAVARVNNPDALLILLLVASAYVTLRAVESGRTKHLLWAGAFVGLAFMTKMLQGWMVVPALGTVYLVAGPPRLRTRLLQLLGAGAVMAAVSAAWPLAVTLWPGAKPYIGGSTDGSVWNLILGYNGLGRVFGEGGGGGGQGASFGGEPGLLRMFNEQVGGQVAWLLPLAAVGLAAGLWLTRGTPRTDLRRAAWLLFGIWALVHVAIFSSQEGIFHPYYVSALAPAVAVLAGAGTVTLWRTARTSWLAFGVLGATVAGTAVLAALLLRRTPDFHPWLQVAIPIAAVIAIGAGAVAKATGRRTAAVVAATALAVAVLAGPASYTFANLGRSLNGNNVLAGPASVGGGLGGPGGGPGRSGGGMGGASGPGGGARPTGTGGPPSGGMGAGAQAGGRSAAPTGGAGASAQAGGPGASASGAGGGLPTGAARGGGGGGLSSEAISYLLEHQGNARFLIAANGAQTTASIILATGKPVVTIGGFSGNDPAPTVTHLARMVAKGELRYVLVSSSGGMGGGPGGGSSAITAWVKAHGTAVSGLSTSGGTVYRVTA